MHLRHDAGLPHDAHSVANVRPIVEVSVTIATRARLRNAVPILVDATTNALVAGVEHGHSPLELASRKM